MNTELDNFKLMASAAEIGWWEADFEHKKYTCSEYICRLLGLEKNELMFSKFHEFIREDFRQMVVDDFTGNHDVNSTFYKKDFPVVINGSEIWVSTQLIKHIYDDDHKAAKRCIGFMRRIPAPANTDASEYEVTSEMLEKQNLISKFFMSFISDDNLEGCIMQVLEYILEIYNSSRVYIIEFDDIKKVYSCRYEVVKDGVERKSVLMNISNKDLKWLNSMIRKAKPIILNSIEQLPIEASDEYELLKKQDIKSMIMLPLISGDTVRGYLGIDVVDRYYSWSDSDYKFFYTIVTMIGICMELRKANENILREKHFFDSMKRNMPLGYVRVSVIRNADGEPEDYMITETNDVFANMFGTKAASYLNKLGSSVNLHGDHNGFNRIMSHIKKGDTGIINGDIYIGITDIYVRMILYHTSHNEIVALLINITELKNKDLEIDNKDKLVNDLLKSIPVGIEIYDRDGNLTDLNDIDMEMFGVTDKEKLLESHQNIFQNPNYEHSALEKLRDENESGFSQIFDFSKNRTDYYPHQNKASVVILYVKVSKIYDSVGRFKGYIVINLDNTEIVNDRNTISDFQSLFSIVSDFAKVGYAKINFQGSGGYAIKQWYKNFGEDENTPLDNITGRYKMFHHEDRAAVLDFYEKAKRGEATHFSKEIRVRDRENPEKWNWVMDNVIVTKYEPGVGLKELLGINYDITQMKEKEEKLVEARDKAQKMDMLKSAFLANMSHEIRTPLNAIIGFSDLVAEIDDVDEKKEYMRIIRENNNILLQLISDILDLSKIEAGMMDFKKSEVNVNDLCSDVIRSASFKLKPGVTMTLDRHLSDCFILSDHNKLTQVMTNFVTNAIKFTNTGSVKIGYDLIGNQIRLYVKDTGIGIPEEKKDQVFDRFVKLNSFIQGTGLGLPICKSIAEGLGGSIGVESELGRGSEFWIKIPIN